jgi:hypothetical protein
LRYSHRLALITYHIITTTQPAWPSQPVSGFFGSWLTLRLACRDLGYWLSPKVFTVLIFNTLQSTAAAELQELGLEGV